MGQMIKFEHNTLVLNNVFSKQDVAEIDRFAEYVRNQEQERIIKLLEDAAMTYNLVSINGEILKQTAPLAAPLDKVIALIKGDKVSGYQK